MITIQGVQYASDFEAKKAIQETARKLYEKGAALAGDGSLSVKVGPNALWITVAGADKSALAQDQLVRLDLNGKQMMSAHPRQLPEDLPVHLKLYRENPGVQCVLHAYPCAATALACCGQGLPLLTGTPALRELGAVQLAPAQSPEQLAAPLAAASQNEKAVLLTQDGCMTWGKTAQQALNRLEALEYGAGLLAQLGGSASAPAQPQPNAAWAPAPVPAPAQDPTAGLKGVTPLVRPGQKAPEPVAAAPAVVQARPCAAVLAAPAVAFAPEAPQPALSVNPTNSPRAAAMAEVVRRRCGQL